MESLDDVVAEMECLLSMYSSSGDGLDAWLEAPYLPVSGSVDIELQVSYLQMCV